jgi:hypothetical protein
MLAAGVHVRVHLPTHDGQDLVAGGAHRDDFCADRRSGFVGNGGRTRTADDDARPGRGRMLPGDPYIGPRGQTHRWQRDGAGDELAMRPQCDVYRPVEPALGVLPGAVQRVYDPHPVGRQPGWVVGGLLGQHRVMRALARQPLHEQVVRHPVSAYAQPVPSAVSQRQQPLTRLVRQPGGQVDVAGVGHGASPYPAGLILTKLASFDAKIASSVKINGGRGLGAVATAEQRAGGWGGRNGDRAMGLAGQLL